MRLVEFNYPTGTPVLINVERVVSLEPTAMGKFTLMRCDDAYYTLAAEMETVRRRLEEEP